MDKCLTYTIYSSIIDGYKRRRGMNKFFSNLKKTLMSKPITLLDHLRLFSAWTGILILGFLAFIAIAMVSGSPGNLTFLFLFCLGLAVACVPFLAIAFSLTAIATLWYLVELSYRKWPQRWVVAFR